jgi:hypothetical protein
MVFGAIVAGRGYGNGLSAFVLMHYYAFER